MHSIRVVLLDRERGGGAGPLPRAYFVETGDKEGGELFSATGRLGHPLQFRLQDVHHDQDAEPALSARGVHQGDSDKLHGHAQRLGRPVVGGGGPVREDRARGEKSQSHSLDQPGQKAAVGFGRQNTQANRRGLRQNSRRRGVDHHPRCQ